MLTIVIPAYNVERYIGKCLRSVFSQGSRHSLRVVIVIDGATDRTRQEAEAAIAETGFAGAEIVDQPNAGLSAARNRGLTEVRTEYVAFLDSDDYWIDGYLDRIVPILQAQQPDIIEFDALLVHDDERPIGVLKISPLAEDACRCISRLEFLDCFRCYAWARVVRTSIARAHPFPEGKRFEDAATIPWYYRASERIVSIGTPLVAYRQRRGSILASPRVEDVLDLASAVEHASSEYRADRDPFWQVVAVRIHQVASGRVPLLPFRLWGRCLAALDAAIAGVPPTKGGLRWLQVRHPRLYLSMLCVKRLLVSRKHPGQPKLFGRSAA